jgi:hypothetical protein
MPRPLSRRLLLGGAVAGLAGCTVQNPIPPAEPDSLLRPDQIGALPAGEGIVAGIGLLAYIHDEANLRRDRYGRSYRLRIVDAAGQAHSLPLTRRGAFVGMGQETRRMEDGNLALEATPFAFRLPAGPCVITALQVYDLTVAYSNGLREHAWITRRVPPAALLVRGGEVTYVGAYGLAQGSIGFASREAMETACGQAGRVFWNTYRCDFSRLIRHADAEADLPLILQRFPGLEGRAIGRATPPPAPGWDSWAEVRQDPLRLMRGATRA